jgi:hypothetical protein
MQEDEDRLLRIFRARIRMILLNMKLRHVGDLVEVGITVKAGALSRGLRGEFGDL